MNDLVKSSTHVHTCHWPGCPRQVPPRMWGCRAHWYALPKELRDLIWATYRPGQEITKTPSVAYVEVAKAVQRWIHSRGAQRLYRPSNGTEGASFITAWCGKCARDKDTDCPILGRTFAYDVNDPNYPKEWHYDGFGQPQCSAFVLEGDPIPAPRCEGTVDMFGGAR